MTSPLPPGITLIRELGRGRLGATSLCRDASGHEVVVTVLEVRPADERSRQELDSELRAAAAAFAHPCAVPIRPGGGDERPLFLTQPYMPGGAPGAESVAPDVVTVGGVRLTAALAQAHAAGMLHGDVRPSNVLRTSDGACMLAAGGVAHALGRAGSESAAQPDPLFAAPEYFSGEQPGAAADVYSLGATLYAALVGEAPHAGAARDGAGALHTARLGPPPELPMSVPAVLAALIRRMLAPDPAERPALNEVDQVLRSLTPAGATLPPALPPRTAAVPPRPAVRLAVTEPAAVAAASKRRTLVAGVAIGALFIGGAVAVTATNGKDGDEANLVASEAPPSAVPSPTPAPRQVRDLSTMTEGQAAAAGYVPRRIEVFVYMGRLSVLWRMTSHAPGLKSFVVLYKRAKNEKRPKVIERSRLAQDTYVYFLDPAVSHTTCVTVRSFLADGRVITPPRLTCPGKYSALSEFDKRITKAVYRTKIGPTEDLSARDA